MSTFDDTFMEVGISAKLKKVQIQSPDKVIIELTTSTPEDFADFAKLVNEPVATHMMKAQGELAFNSEDEDITDEPLAADQGELTMDGDGPQIDGVPLPE